MPTSKAKRTISDVLRQTIRESGVPLLRIDHATGLARQRIMHFLRGDQTLQLRNAERLAAYFRLKMIPTAAVNGRRQRRRAATHSAARLLAARNRAPRGTGQQPLSEVLRDAIRACGLPLARIERKAGVSRARIRRFLRGGEGLRLRSVDKLAAYFGLELVAPTGTGKPTRALGDTFLADTLFAARKLVEIAGGIDRARQAVEWVERLR